MPILLLLFPLLTIGAYGAPTGSEGHGVAPNVDPNVKLVIMGMRHGNRNPVQFLTDDPNKSRSGLEGASELTNYGKRQAYATGQSVNERYGRLLGNFYQPSQMKAYSSSANRCQMTLQTALAGVFPPIGRSEWNHDVRWQAVPYKIDNALLRMYAVDECTTGNVAWRPIIDDNLPNLSSWLDRDKVLVDYVAKHTGWNGSLSNLGDVADNLRNIKTFGLQLPNWVKTPDDPALAGKDLYKEIVKFAEAHQIACAEYRPCAYIMGGYWLNDIVETLKRKKDGKSEKLKFVIYVSHMEVTLSTMKLMQMGVKECKASAGFLLEYRDQPSPSVRQLVHEPHPTDPDRRIILVSTLSQQCSGHPVTNCRGSECETDGGWCSLEDFVNRVRNNTFSDWKAECKVPMPACQTGSGPNRAITMTINCAQEKDELKIEACRALKSSGHCRDHNSTKYVHCRKTCLCA